ncbi:MAG: ABC transporter permease [Gemmatimonadales bacterium]
MTALDSIITRAYRAALHLYPPAFRRRFGDEMLAFAAEGIAAASRRGMAAAAREAAYLAADVARSVPSQWLSAFRAARQRAAAEQLPRENPRDTMDIIAQDLRFALRGLARRPAFTVVAAITLALGIGANTAIFSVVDAVLIRALPFDDPGRLVMVWGTQGAQGSQGVSYADYVDWRRDNRTFADLGALRGQSVNLTGGDVPDRLIGAFVSASLFRVVGAHVSRGRVFTDAETELATTAPVAVISYEAWHSRFGADPAMVGRSITVNGTAFTVVGILAPNTPMPLGFAADVSLPIGYYPNAHGLDRGTRGIWVVGRLAPGATIDAAQHDLSAIEARLANAYSATNAGTGAEVHSLEEDTVGPTRDRLFVILGAVALVLLIACANVANLQLARGASRSRELSVRAALGAGRGRIAQQLLTESVVLSLFGGTLGVLLAMVLTPALVSLIGAQLPVDASSIHLNGVVLAFAFGVSLATGLLFGIAPAWKSSRTDLGDMLRTRTAGLRHLATRNLLVVVQLALSLALLASAGLLTRSLMALGRVDPGFDGDRLLTAQFRLPPAKYDTPEKIWAMFDRTIAEIRSLPGVESAALVRASPLSGNGESYAVTIDGRPPVKPGDAPSMQLNTVTTDYFATMQIPIVAGRDIAPTDRIGALPVIVVNRLFAEQTWPGESPIGKRIQVSGDWRTVVGVVGDTRHFTLNEQPLLQGYIPHAQRPQVFTSLVVRTRGNPLDLAKSVREAIWRVDREQPVWRFRSMQQDLDAVVTSSKTTAWLVMLFAVVALAVAAVGVYGVMSYTMSQRTQEVGIRIALGASSRQVARMVLGEGARLIAIAVCAGLVASMGAARLLRSQLYGVGPNDVGTFVAVTAVLAVVAALACYLPARRASRVDPMVALRAE